MNPRTLFVIFNTGTLLVWFWLIIAPRWTWTKRIVWRAIPILLSGAYTIILTAFFGQAEGGFDSLENVMRLFTNEWIALAAWIHYLAFDLFVGIWEVRDAQEKSIPHLLVIPCLVLTFLFGPAGFLAYSVIRSLYSIKGANI